MEGFAEALADDLSELNSNFDGSSGTFITERRASSSFIDPRSSSVRYVEQKLIPATHPTDVKGGGSFEITRGQPLSDKFSGMIDAVTGELVHGKRMYVITGETYEGPFSNGNLRHGDGAIVKNLYIPRNSFQDSSLPTISSASKFYGSFRNDKPHYGTLVVSSQGLGFTYHGPFSLSKPHGKNGTLVKNSGYKYVGDFVNGLYHGNGVEYEEKSQGGGIYDGGFVEGARQGYGTYTIKTSSKLKHDEGNPKGKATEEYSYKGRWHGNRKQGDGEELIRDSEFYKGQFHMNQRHGFGSLSFIQTDEETDMDKEVEEEEIQSNHSSKATDKKHEGAFVVVKAEGQWRAGKPLDGSDGWTLVSNNGDVYSGFASNFTPQGHGIMQYCNKDVYTGQWRDGKRHGEGMFISADGREEYIGHWIDNKIAPSAIVSKDNGVLRITDLTQVLLHSSDQKQHSGNSENDQESFQTKLDILQKIVDQSLSKSLMHFETDLKNPKANEWVHSNYTLKSDISQTDSTECTETSIEAAEADLVRVTHCGIEDAAKDQSCMEGDESNESRAQLLTYPNGDTYLGSLSQHTKRRDGHGVYLSAASGTTYSGNFNDDMRHGFGILIHPLGKYCGNFFEDKKHGKGTLILNDTSSYNGQFQNNHYHGRGTLCNQDGVYVGDWINGMKQGDGYETLPDGRVYMGDFHKSKRHGYGTLLSEACGEVEYNGQWQSGLYHGEGLLVKYIKPQPQEKCNHFETKTLFSSSKGVAIPMIRYEGTFYNGLRHGHGKLTNTLDKSDFSGYWRKDLPVSGKWKINMSGSSYSGEASIFEDDAVSSSSNDDENTEGLARHLSCQSLDNLPHQLDVAKLALPQPHGFGTMKYSNGDVYVGNFVRGLRQGPGTCVFAKNKERWDGQWFNDKQTTRQNCIANIGVVDVQELGFEEISIND